MAMPILREYILEGKSIRDEAEERIRESLEAAAELAWACSR